MYSEAMRWGVYFRVQIFLFVLNENRDFSIKSQSLQKLNFSFHFCFFRRKYPEFVQYMSQFLQQAECSVCKEALDQADIILTNPCGHLLCAGQ